MKTDVNIVYFMFDSWIHVSFFYDAEDLTKVLHLSYESMSSESIWKVDHEGLLAYRVPNYYECHYMDEYESTIFQTSLVWNKDLPFFLLLEIQKFISEIIKNNELHKLDVVDANDYYVHTFEY